MFSSFGPLKVLGKQRFWFSTSQVSQGRIRQVLSRAAKAQDPEELKELETKLYDSKKTVENPEIVAKPIKPITRQHAAHLLSKLTGEPVDMHTLGPLSNDDIKYFKVADKRIMCVLLGTTPNQLLDSVVVDNTVKSFISRNQIEKALMTSRLAKDKGVVAMNRIMGHFLKQRKVNDVLHLLSTRKKWGIPINDFTLTILFDGCSELHGPKGEPGLTTQQVEKLQKILLGLTPGYKIKPNIIHINSAFSALLNCEDQTIGLELWENWLKNKEPFLKSFKPNTTTYSIILKALGHQKNDLITMVYAETILKQIINLPLNKQDDKLFESYIFAYLRCQRLDFIERGLKSVEAFFDIETYTPKLKKKHPYLHNVPQKVKLDEIVPLKSKFIPTNSLIDILMKSYIQLGDNENAIKLFYQYNDSHPGSVDLSIIHRYFIVLRELKRSEAGIKSVEFYKELTSGKFKTKIAVNSVTRFMVFNSIYTQSLATLNDKGTFAIGKSVDVIYNLANDFYSFISKDVTSHEVYGYLKSIRRLRLSKTQREELLKLIADAKVKFDEELKASKDFKQTKFYISQVLETEKYLINKQEKKLILQKLDEEEKFKARLNDGKGIIEEKQV